MNLGLLLDMAVGGFGSRIAVGSRDDGLTFDRVAALAGRLAADLRGGDLRTADRGADGPSPGGRTVAVVAPMGLHTPVALFGATAAGFSYAPLNHRLPPESLAELVRRLDPALLLAGAEHHRELARSVAAGRSGDARSRVAGPSFPAPGRGDQATSSDRGQGGGAAPLLVEVDGWLGELGARATGERQPFQPVDGPEAPAVVLYTSGTSSAPKAAVLGHGNLLAYVHAAVELGSAGEDEANLVAAPPFHVAGLVNVLTSCFAGRRVVPLARFTAEGWIDLAVQERVTHAFVVPTMLARIVAALDAGAAGGAGGAGSGGPLPPLRQITYGGARLPLPVLERALELFPDTNFVNAYGLTETSATVAILGPDDHREAAASSDPAVRRRLESAGRPLPGVELRIVAADGTPAPTGQPGEIWVRGDQVGGSYLDTASRLDGDGWLHTGDQGWVDEGGYLFVGGRLDDMIISGGENISPAEVENVLLRHPDVAAAAVVGVTDPEWGERVGAVIVPRPGAGPPEAADLTAWVRERLGTLKAPTVVLFRSDLPTTATGKVLKRTLKADLESPQR